MEGSLIRVHLERPIKVKRIPVNFIDTNGKVGSRYIVHLLPQYFARNILWGL